MKKSSVVAACLALAATLAASPVTAQTELAGTTQGGAHYRIVVPSAWNGDLVIWNHGFDLAPVGPVDDLGPLEEFMGIQGFAVAASSYRQTGWAVFKSTEDLRNMVRVFTQNFGAPDRVFVTGASLGGIVTAAAIEQGGIGNVVGALTICGAMAGSRNWDGAVDLRLVYDAVCGDVAGAAIPGGPKGLPRNTTLRQPDIAEAVNACTGILLPPGQRTAAQKRRLNTISRVTRLPKSFLLTDMGYVTFGLQDLVYAPGKLRRRFGAGNMDVDYGNAQVNRDIQRVRPKPRAENRLDNHYTPTGEVGDVKIVSIHTNKDGLVIVENQTEYAEVVPPENLTVGIVRERVPSHCGFSPSEVAAAWTQLLAWTDGGTQPTARDLDADCEGLSPLLGGPCRYDPGFVLKDMDRRIRPR